MTEKSNYDMAQGAERIVVIEDKDDLYGVGSSVDVMTAKARPSHSSPLPVRDPLRSKNKPVSVPHPIIIGDAKPLIEVISPHNTEAPQNRNGKGRRTRKRPQQSANKKNTQIAASLANDAQRLQGQFEALKEVKNELIEDVTEQFDALKKENEIMKSILNAPSTAINYTYYDKNIYELMSNCTYERHLGGVCGFINSYLLNKKFKHEWRIARRFRFVKLEDADQSDQRAAQLTGTKLQYCDAKLAWFEYSEHVETRYCDVDWYGVERWTLWEKLDPVNRHYKYKHEPKVTMMLLSVELVTQISHMGNISLELDDAVAWKRLCNSAKSIGLVNIDRYSIFNMTSAHIQQNSATFAFFLHKVNKYESTSLDFPRPLPQDGASSMVTDWVKLLYPKYDPSKRMLLSGFYATSTLLPDLLLQCLLVVITMELLFFIPILMILIPWLLEWLNALVPLRLYLILWRLYDFKSLSETGAMYILYLSSLMMISLLKRGSRIRITRSGAKKNLGGNFRNLMGYFLIVMMCLISLHITSAFRKTSSILNQNMQEESFPDTTHLNVSWDLFSNLLRANYTNCTGSSSTFQFATAQESSLNDSQPFATVNSSTWLQITPPMSLTLFGKLWKAANSYFTTTCHNISQFTNDSCGSVGECWEGAIFVNLRILSLNLTRRVCQVKCARPLVTHSLTLWSSYSFVRNLVHTLTASSRATTVFLLLSVDLLLLTIIVVLGLQLSWSCMIRCLRRRFVG